MEGTKALGFIRRCLRRGRVLWDRGFRRRKSR